jgi:hypothetical protein
MEEEGEVMRRMVSFGTARTVGVGQYRLMAILSTKDRKLPACACLYQDSRVVPGSQIGTDRLNGTECTSGNLGLEGGEYEVRFGGWSGGEYSCYGADLVLHAGERTKGKHNPAKPGPLRGK